MKIVVYTLVIAVLLIGGCYSSQESSFRAGYDFSRLDKIAIAAVEGTVKSETARDQIADFFAIELLERGYAPIGRAQVRALLEEQESESKGLTTTEEAVETGLLLNVPAVLTISIPHFGPEISITAKMIDVEDASILWLASGSGKGEGTLSGIFGFVTRADRGTGVSGEEDELLGPVMAGVLGETAGQPLSLQEARRAQRIVKKMCRSLPPKLTPEW